jgi:hypothetical protein
MRKILMSIRHSVLKFVRQFHLYLGVFTAPALLFFAFTGGLQAFSLHEAHRGSDYKPPAWLVTMAQLHKKQTMVVPAHRKHPVPTRPAAGEGMREVTTAAPAVGEMPRPVMRTHNALPLKIFVGLVALALFLSTLTGLYMAYRYTRNKRLVSFALVAGVVVPVVLALF